MKKILKGALLLSLLSITLGININNYGNDNLGESFSLINTKNKATSVTSESRLKVTTIDGEDATGKYQVVDRGSGKLSTQITTSGDYLITQDDSSTYANEQIVIGPNVTGTIKLLNLNLMYSTSNEQYRESTIQIDPTSNVTLFFDGDNVINRNGNDYPGIGYYGSEDSFTGKLTIEGSAEGESYIYGGSYASAIGGTSAVVFDNEGGKENSSTVGEIVVNSGNFTISAFGAGASAIGSGEKGHIKGITINGGNLNLKAGGTSGSSGAVIGSATNGSCDYIHINGGNLNVTNIGSFNKSDGAGIGSGNSAECKEIIINGGNINTETYSAPGIGLGKNYSKNASKDQKIIINGGTITTSVNNTSKGIGYYADNSVPVSKVEINGGSVKSSFSIDPLNSKDEKLYLAKIEEAKDVTNVIVNEEDFHIDSNHLNDNSLYLYLPGKDSKIKVNNSDTLETYDAKFLENNSFEVTLEKPNSAPIIEAEDKYIEIGTTITDEILLDGVSVKDDNDLNLKAYVKSHNIDSSTIGTYEVTYEVKDSGGLTSTKTVKVYIYQGFAEINNIPTLKGEDKTVQYGSTFDDVEALKGITASDIEDGNLTDEIKVVSNPVVTTQPGEYEVTYSVTDKDGATGYLTIKVTVLEKPNVAPTINAEDKYIEIGATITDELLLDGVTVNDDNDQNLKAYVKSHNIDSSTIGTYEVTYEVKDSGGLVATKTIKVYIYQGFAEINNIPTLKGEDKTIEYGSTFNDAEALKGITASDIEDGNLTDEIKVVSNPVVTTQPGEYEVTYSVTDKDGATSYLTIKVTVLEKPNVAPTINAEDKYIEIGTAITDELLLDGVTVEDDNDQNLKAYVKSHNIDSSTIGTYEVTYEVKDSGGLTSTKTVKVYIYQGFAEINNIPKIKGEDKTVEYGSTFDDAEALKGITASDIEDGDLTNKIKVVSNPVTTTQPGEYEVTYSVTDKDGATGYLIIKVTVLEKPVVSEEDKPVITVQDITLNVNDKFDNTDALKYVSAKDKDGNAISNVEVILNEVDTSKPGEYKIGFKATDKNGNSQIKYATVKVVENKQDNNSDLIYFIVSSVVILAISIVVLILFIIFR